MTTITERITARRTELTKQRSERQDELDLPRTLTQREVDAYLSETERIGQTISSFESAVSQHAELQNGDDDSRWLSFLTKARDLLCSELLTFKSPLRDKVLQERAQGLHWSIKLIDRGFAIRGAATIVTLAPTRIGELMIEAGFAVEGDGLRGPNGWGGSLGETEKRMALFTKRRSAAEAVLDKALMSDKERAERDAEADARREAFRTMDVRNGDDPHTPYLVAYDADGDVLSVDAMSPTQRAAFEAANDLFITEQAARLEASIAQGDIDAEHELPSQR